MRVFKDRSGRTVMTTESPIPPSVAESQAEMVTTRDLLSLEEKRRRRAAAATAAEKPASAPDGEGSADHD